MKIKRVGSQAASVQFLEAPVYIYKDDPNWVRPLNKDIEDVFFPRVNKLYKKGTAARWILIDDEGNLAGRVAAFINTKSSAGQPLRCGGFGFFECINNKEAAFMLLDQVQKWLVGREMEVMEGPINFGEKDKWWGLLVDGFTPPTYGMNYNPPYYRQFFEEYGLKTYYEQYVYQWDTKDPLPERFLNLYNRLKRDPRYTFRHINKKDINACVDDFRTVYNKAWVNHTGFNAMDRKSVTHLFESLKPILDNDTVWYAYHDGEPVAFFIMIPEINQIIKNLNGKLNLINKLKFAWQLRKKSIRRLYGIIFGVVPEFQRKGVEAALIAESYMHVQPLGRYEELEMTWIGDFNPRMISMLEALGAKKIKTLITYRKIFDPNIEFERAPMIG